MDTSTAHGLGLVSKVAKGTFNIIALAFQEEVLPQTSSFMHSDIIIGDPNSLSDARLKSEVAPVSGTQALSALSQIQGCTYEREDLQQRRLGLIADEVEDAIDQLAIDNVVGSKWHQGGGVQDPRLRAVGSAPHPGRQRLKRTRQGS